jgi:tetratricopeptide (TPR) repeat protein
MKAATLSIAVIAVSLAGASSASVMTFGSSNAESCYQSVETRSLAITAMRDCDAALREASLSTHDRAGTFVNRGILFMRGKNLMAAQRDFDAAIATDPGQPEAWLNKGIALIAKGDSAGALPLVDRALQLQTRRPAMAHYARAIAHEDSGNLRAAYADLLVARRLEPKWSAVKQDLARFRVSDR